MFKSRCGYVNSPFNPESEMERVKRVKRGKMLERKLFGKIETIPEAVW